MAAPKADATYVYDGADIGVDDGRLVRGTAIRVRELVDAATPGAHDASEDCVVIEWDAPALVHTEKGVEVGHVNRAMSVSSAVFDADFKKD